MANPKINPDEVMFTLDQLEQTTEVMNRVVSRLKRQFALQQEQMEQDHRNSAPQTEKTSPSSTLH